MEPAERENHGSIFQREYLRLLVMLPVLGFVGILSCSMVSKFSSRQLEQLVHFSALDGNFTTASPLPIIEIEEPEIVVRPQLGCDEISRLKVVRSLGEGRQKRAYVVELPWGEYAVAKRCISEKCFNKKQVAKEAQFLHGLYDQYGDQAVQFYGECKGPVRSSQKKNPKSIVGNFSLGYTSIGELATPFLDIKLILRLKDKDMEFRECFARHFTETDEKDFLTIALQYANHSDYPYTMHSLTRNQSDLRFVEQYALTKAGIRNIDVDMVYPCEKCSMLEAFEINCHVVEQVLFRDLNCSSLNPLLDHSFGRIKNASASAHINVTEAKALCQTKVMTTKREK